MKTFRRASLARTLGLAAAATLAACGPPDEPSDEASRATAEPDAAESIRTADPYARGYTDADFPRVQELAEGVYSYEQLRSAGDERFTTVSLIVVTDEGVLIGDGQGSVEETERLVEHVAELADQPITHVVIGSDHGDHTAGNSAFPDGVRYYAHPTSAEALRRTAEGRSADDPPMPLATDLVEDREVLQLGDRTVELLFLGRAHTGGDLVVHLPEEKIFFMSEAYLHRVFPAMRSAFPSEWVEMIERAQAMDIDVYVPGHGFVDSPGVLEDELEVYRQAVVQVIGEARRLHEEEVPLEAAQEQASFGDLETWSLRSSQGPVAIRQVYAELNGELPGGER
jgi:glyoxylase-like metal-dependent hydrolase (beta-lactamase superfamily II)